MKSRITKSLYRIVVIWTGIITFSLLSCERLDLKRLVKISITSTSDITINSVMVEAEFIDFGDNPIEEYGFCISENQGPSLTDYYSTVGKSPEVYTFNAAITNLSYGREYYVNAFAKTYDSVYYSNEISFTTLDINLPMVTTAQSSFVTSNSAICGGTILDTGNSENIVCGVCWGTAIYPTTRDSKTVDIPDQDQFTSNITGLSPGTKYYLRAYVTNEIGTAYGSEISFTTQDN